MTAIRLQIERWAAWAPGLESQAAWLDWLRAPTPVATSGAPALAEMPAMMRRRIEPHGRVALQVAYWTQGEEPTGPVVFASRWGEMPRSVEMLRQLAAGEALSPTAFSLSVHNAIGALFSIARKDRNNYQAVSAGEHSVEAGFMEAAGLIADGAEHVLLVFFDGPLAEIYQPLVPDAADDFPHAFALLLSRAQGSGGFSLGTQTPASADESSTRAMPSSLQTLRYLVDTCAGSAASHQAGRWTWQRHVA